MNNDMDLEINNFNSQSPFCGLEIDALCFFNEDAKQLDLVFALDAANMALYVFEQGKSISNSLNCIATFRLEGFPFKAPTSMCLARCRDYQNENDLRIFLTDADAGIIAQVRFNISTLCFEGRSEIVCGRYLRCGYKDGTSQRALFSSPAGICWNPKSSLLYVCDMDNHCIRVIHNAMNLDRIYVTTLAGVCSQEPMCEKFPDGFGLASYFFCPRSIAIDFNCKYLYVTEDTCLRRIDIDTAEVTTLCGSVFVYSSVTFKNLFSDPVSSHVDGNISEARFKSLHFITIDIFGKLLVIDHGNHILRMIDTNKKQVETISASFDGPFAMTLGKEGKLLVGDFNVGEANLKSVFVSNLFCSTNDTRLTLMRSALKMCRITANSVKENPKHFSVIRELTRVSLLSCGLSIGGVNAFLEFGLDRKTLKTKQKDASHSSLLSFFGQLFSEFPENLETEVKTDQHSRQFLVKSISKQIEMIPMKTEKLQNSFDDLMMDIPLPHTPNLTLRQ